MIQIIYGVLAGLALGSIDWTRKIDQRNHSSTPGMGKVDFTRYYFS